MGQSEIIQFLESNPNKRFTTRDLSIAFNTRPSILGEPLRKLRRTDFINWEFVRIDNHYHNPFRYEYWSNING